MGSPFTVVACMGWACRDPREDISAGTQVRNDIPCLLVLTVCGWAEMVLDGDERC